MNDTGMENLCNAIVIQAAEDYATAYMGDYVEHKSPPSAMKECEKFFHSEWYKELTTVDGDFLMKQVKVRELEKAINAFTAALNVSRAVTYKISVRKTDTEEKVDYNLPPRLAAAFTETVKVQLKLLQEELRMVQGND